MRLSAILQEASSTTEAPVQVDHKWLSREQPCLVVSPETLHISDSGPAPAPEVGCLAFYVGTLPIISMCDASVDVDESELGLMSHQALRLLQHQAFQG